MKKRKGFTLVELLATIVIISIIALITTAVILGVIADADKEAFKSSVLGVIDSIDYWLYENDLDEIPDGQCIPLSELDIKNADQFDEESCVKNDNGNVSVIVCNKKYCAAGPKDNLVIVDDRSKLDQTPPEIVDSGIIVSRTTNSITIKITDGSIKDDETGIKNYQYQISSEKLNINQKSKETENTEYTFSNLKSGTYKVTVIATNKVGLSSQITKEVTLLTCSIPTISVSPEGYATEKVATINYGENNTCTGSYSYSEDEGKTFSEWKSGTSLKITKNGIMIMARNTDGINTVASSTYTVSGIDSSKVSCDIVATGTKGNNDWYTSNVDLKMETNAAGVSGLKYELSTSTTPSYNNSIDKEGVKGTATQTIASATGTITYYGYVKNGVGTTGKCSITFKRDNVTPTNPTIVASDSKLSGQWHAQAYNLTLSGASSPSGITYYYGTTSTPTTAGSKISSGKGISTVGTQTYYAKACNGAGTCSNNTSYIASLETCDPEINLTFTNSGGGSLAESSSACYIDPVVAKATTGCSGGTYTWYVDDEIWNSEENSSKTESTLSDWIQDTGTHTISVKLEKAGTGGNQYYTKTVKINTDYDSPGVTTSVTTTSSTANVVINATDVGCSGIDTSKYVVMYKAASDSSWKTLSLSTNTAKITGLTPGTTYNFKAKACDNGDNCETSNVVTKATTSLSLPELKLTSANSCGINGSIEILPSELEKQDINLDYTIKIGGSYDLNDSSGSQTSPFSPEKDSYIDGSDGILSNGNLYTLNLNDLYNDYASQFDNDFSSTYGITLIDELKTGSSIIFCATDSESLVCKTYTSGGGVYDTTAPTTNAPTITNITSSSIIVKRNQSDSESGLSTNTSYSKIRYKKSTDSTWTTKRFSVNLATTSVTISGLTPNTKYDVETYAVDNCGNESWSTKTTITTENYIYGCTYSNLTYAGYKVTCNVDSSVASVKFPTWTSANGQDDIKWHEATISNGKATYTVKTADHNYEDGAYITHGYAYNSSGNIIGSGVGAATPTVPNSGPYTKYGKNSTYGGGLVWEDSNTINPYVKIATKGDSTILGSSSVTRTSYMTTYQFLNMLGEKADYEEWSYNITGTSGALHPLDYDYEFEIDLSTCNSYLYPITGEACNNSTDSDYYFLQETNNNYEISFDYDCYGRSNCLVTLSWITGPPSYPIVIKNVSK